VESPEGARCRRLFAQQSTQSLDYPNGGLSNMTRKAETITGKEIFLRYQQVLISTSVFEAFSIPVFLIAPQSNIF
jgi:hypothetical protein